MTGIKKERSQERLRYGETVFLLEPNVKRSRGGLRDVQLLRWAGMAHCGTCEKACRNMSRHGGAIRSFWAADIRTVN